MPATLGIVAAHRTAVAVPPPIPTTGLMLWHDADDASTFTLAGNLVEEWRDKTGAAIGNPEGGQRPTRETNVVNGRAAVAFTAQNQIVPNMAGVSSSQKPFTVTVAMSHSMANYGTILGASVSGGMEIRIQPNHTVDLMRTQVAAIGSSSSPLPAAATVLSVMYTAAGQYSFWFDGVAAGTGTNNQTFTAGGGTNYNSGGAYYWTGRLLEVTKYNRDLPTAERQQVESYLKTKWGIP